MKTKIVLPLVSIVFASQAALADGIKLPGISIDEDGIKAPGVEITDEGIKAPGVTIDDEGVSAPGVRVDDDGVSAPGVRIGAGDRTRMREARKPGKYDDQFFGTDGSVSRDKFDGMDLRGYDFSGYRLDRVKFVDTDLEGADFRGAILDRVEFDNVNLEGADFSDTILSRVEFEDSRLGGACFIYASMDRAEFDDSDLTDAVWIGVQADRTDFSNSDRGRLITRGPDNCFDHHSAIGGSVVKTSLIDRLEVKGFGEERPVADNESDQGKSLNRRVTLVNLGSV